MSVRPKVEPSLALTIIGRKQRRSEHLHYLRRGTHHAKHLQRCWDKHGADSIEFAVIEEVEDIAFLLAREQFHIWRVDPAALLNTAPVSDSVYAAQAACRGRVMGADERAMRSRAQTGLKRAPWSQERRERHSVALTGRSMPPVADETRAKISAAKKGKANWPAINASRAAKRAKVDANVQTWAALSEQGHSFRAIERITGNCRRVIAREIARLQGSAG